MKTIAIDNLTIHYTDSPDYRDISYVLMPIDVNLAQIADWCKSSKSNLAFVTGMDWDDDLTPWAAPGVPKGTAAFKGLAPLFLKRIEQTVAPAVEALMPEPMAARNLVGISLSGLFALWAWMRDDYFRSICCLSGSFWYEDFTKWLSHIAIPEKEGSAYFLLGTLEPKSKNPVFRTVGECTEQVLELLRGAGIKCEFEWVPGDHYANTLPRLERAFAFLGTVD